MTKRNKATRTLWENARIFSSRKRSRIDLQRQGSMPSNQTFHDKKPITNVLTNGAKTCKNFVFKKTEVYSLCKLAPNLFHIGIDMRPPNLNLWFFFLSRIYLCNLCCQSFVWLAWHESAREHLKRAAKPRVAIEWKYLSGNFPSWLRRRTETPSLEIPRENP